MKRFLLMAVVLALAAAGCKKPQGPQTTELQAAPPLRPVEQLEPEPAEPTSPGPSIAAGPSAAPPKEQPEPLAAQSGRTHTIQKGDTLWSLAKKYLGDSKRWKEIAELNPQIKVQALPVGKTIVIPEK